jgi:hypothetical protein
VSDEQKPHIKKLKKQWRCDGHGFYRHGTTPSRALANWLETYAELAASQVYLAEAQRWNEAQKRKRLLLAPGTTRLQ